MKNTCAKYLFISNISPEAAWISGELTNTKSRRLFEHNYIILRRWKRRTAIAISRAMNILHASVFLLCSAFFAVRLERAWCIKRGECKRTNSVWLTKSNGTAECPRIFLRRTFSYAPGYRAMCFKKHTYIRTYTYII